MPAKVYLDQDADLLDLQNRVCAVIGFGSQGHAHALNLKKRMKQILDEIQNGDFAKGWIGEYKHGLPTYKELLEQGEKHPIEEVGMRLRSLMPWV